MSANGFYQKVQAAKDRFVQSSEVAKKLGMTTAPAENISLREAQYEMLGSLVEKNYNLLDLFSGSGVTPLRLLSEGLVSTVTFVDKDEYQTGMLQYLINEFGLQDRATVTKQDFKEGIKGNYDLATVICSMIFDPNNICSFERCVTPDNVVDRIAEEIDGKSLIDLLKKVTGQIALIEVEPFDGNILGSPMDLMIKSVGNYKKLIKKQSTFKNSHGNNREIYFVLGCFNQ
jgi:hypothetical protein